MDVKQYFDEGIEPRECQIHAMKEFIHHYKQGKKKFLFRGEVGSGKSHVAKAILNCVGSGYMATPSKLLQKQYERDFKDLEILMGKNNFNCILTGFEDKKVSQAPCRQAGFVKCTPRNYHSGRYEYMKGVCPYHQMIEDVNYAPFVNANFHALYSYLSNFILPTKGVTILDECHDMEKIFSDFVSLKIKGKKFPDIDLKVNKNEYKIEIFLKIKKTLKERIEHLSGLMDINDDELKELDECISQLDTISFILSEGQGNFAIWNPEKELTEKDSYIDLIVKPIYLGDFIKGFIDTFCDITCFFSATVNFQEFCSSNGFTQDEVAYIEMENDFPLENAPIINFYDLLGIPDKNLNFKNLKLALPRMCSLIEKICKDDFYDTKILVHTHSGQIEKYLQDNIDLEGIPTVWGNEYEKKEDMIKTFQELDNGVLFTYSGYQGLDLADEQCRITIFCKIPFLPIVEPYIEARSKYIFKNGQKNNFYNWETALKVIQGCGRGIRNKNDYGIVIFLDNLSTFIYRNGYLLDKKTIKRCNLHDNEIQNVIDKIKGE